MVDEVVANYLICFIIGIFWLFVSLISLISFINEEILHPPFLEQNVVVFFVFFFGIVLSFKSLKYFMVFFFG